MKNEALLLNTGVENPTQAFIALVVKEKDENGYTTIEVRNYFEKGDSIECFMPNGKTINIKMPTMYTLENEKIDVARHPKQILKIKINKDLPVNTFIRKK